MTWLLLGQIFELNQHRGLKYNFFKAITIKHHSYYGKFHTPLLPTSKMETNHYPNFMPATQDKLSLSYHILPSSTSSHPHEFREELKKFKTSDLQCQASQEFFGYHDYQH